MRAAYTLVDERTLDRLVSLAPEVLVSTLEELESGGSPTVYLDKMWDGLHFLLTGVSAATPRDDDPLSESVVGVHVFDGEDFVGCTENDELQTIIEALESLDRDEVIGGADFAAFAEAGIYPNVWDDDPDVLRRELTDAWDALASVHRRAADEGHHLVISIF
ncbi:YfbM family protein [Microbacterium sp. SSW1-49]|uniref:YfbM family protein n=1 Tax=Microbacterium croceum TaxID=2851645 RepID=A0ABT0FID8_9MICO|nr:YfbM family protein [Microbacterium croceum]MCK2037821.1 YfbM family protein [Microbacterium croceum]